jgi:hypothetical protein
VLFLLFDVLSAPVQQDNLPEVRLDLATKMPARQLKFATRRRNVAEGARKDSTAGLKVKLPVETFRARGLKMGSAGLKVKPAVEAFN